jgi:DcuC family C4-dicarboxylate transporter
MLTFIEILIGIVVIVGVARYIIKGYSATGVLFVGGLILLIVSALLGHKVLPGNTAAPVTPPPILLNTLRFSS